MIHYSPNGSFPSRMSPSSKLSVKKRLKSRHKRAICSFLDDEVEVRMVDRVVKYTIQSESIRSFT